MADEGNKTVVEFKDKKEEQEKEGATPNKEESASPSEFKKTLGFAFIFLLALNYIFDSAIFYIPQMGVELSGPSSIIAWVILAGISIYVAMCFAEVISMYPTEGGIYEVCKKAYGSFLSFLGGWTTWLAGNFALIISIPAGLEILIQSETNAAYILKFLISLGTLLLLSYLTLRGRDISSRIMAYFTILIILSFAILLFSTYIDLPSIFEKGALATPLDFSNYMPFFKHEGFFANFGFIFATIFVISISFFGLESVTFLSGEVKNPKHVIPKVLVGSMAIVLAITFIFVIGSIAVLDQATYASAYIFYEDLMNATLGKYGAFLTAFVVIMSGIIYFSEGLGWIISSPRLIFSIAKDKLFPTSFAVLDKKHGSPLKAIKFQAVILTIGLIINYCIYMFTDIDAFYVFVEFWLYMIIPLTIMLLLSIPILRKKEPKEERRYKVPLGTTLPYIISIFLALATAAWIYFAGDYYTGSYTTLFMSIAAILAGIPVYFALLLAFDPDFYIKMKRIFNSFIRVYESYSLRKSVRDEIFNYLGEIEGKNIFEFGCGGGTLTMELAKRVGPKGRVFSVDLEHKSITIAKERITKKKHENVYFVHDEHMINRVHTSIPRIHSIISVDMLSHIQDLKKVAKEMYILLPDNGRICFKDTTDIFKFGPNIGWIADPEETANVLKSVGFKVQYRKVKGLLWNELYIYGAKLKEDVPFI